MRQLLFKAWVRLRRLHRTSRNRTAKPVQAVGITPLLTTTATASGQPLEFPQKNPQVVVSIYEMPPGMVLPDHQHPFLRYGYMLAGQLRVTNLQTGKIDMYGPGDFGIEAIGQWHRGETIGSETVRILVIDQVEEGRDNVSLRA
jgi:quercetin dioxygenase-like cupin family protein